MSPVKITTLSFPILDDLAFAAARGRLEDQPVPMTTTASIGPFLELWQLGAAGLLPGPESASWLAFDGMKTFYRELRTGRRHWVCPTTRSIGFFRPADQSPEAQNAEILFGMEVQRAASSVGFSRTRAQQLVGALRELIDNIIVHSGAPESGLAAFKASDGDLELVVCDQGIGVLESLRTTPEQAGLTDHGDALRLALTEGVSRFGSDANRGKGFRPLFVGLANIWGSLRFRSGDHALTIDGQSPSLIAARCAQKAPIPGFFASVQCRVAKGLAVTHG